MKNNLKKNELKLLKESFDVTYQEMVILSQLKHQKDFINDANQRFVLYSAVNRNLSSAMNPINAKEVASELELSFQTAQKNLNYLDPKADGKKIITLILGGPNKYYGFSEKQMTETFAKIKNLFVYSKYKLIIIPSYRTPENIVKLAFNYFNDNHLVIKERDKKAYLSSLGLADIIIVTCDSTSMISEAAITGKPVYVAQMRNKRSIHRFEKFYKLFKELGIIKDLDNKIENWTYTGLDEVNRAASLVKEKMKTNGII